MPLLATTGNADRVSLAAARTDRNTSKFTVANRTVNNTGLDGQ